MRENASIAFLIQAVAKVVVVTHRARPRSRKRSPTN